MKVEQLCPVIWESFITLNIPVYAQEGYTIIGGSICQIKIITCNPAGVRNSDDRIPCICRSNLFILPYDKQVRLIREYNLHDRFSATFYFGRIVLCETERLVFVG